jgi:hypothetical protein
VVALRVRVRVRGIRSNFIKKRRFYVFTRITSEYINIIIC